MNTLNGRINAKSLLLGAVVGACIVLAAAAATTSGNPTAWEYKVASPPHGPGFGGASRGPEQWRELQQTFLNDLGKEGWVLVSQNEGRLFYLKRPVK